MDNSGKARMLFIDLSKAFDRLRHDLLIARLAAYGFDQPSVCFIISYLSDRKQRTKVNSADSSYTDFKYGVPQGSIIGPLLFNIELIGVIYFCGTMNATKLVMQMIALHILLNEA